MASTLALEKGKELAGYRIEGILGQGGMGVVYEATQLSLNRTIALKLLAANLGDDPAFRERFRREGLLQAAIDHPNIVTVYEAGETEEGLFLAMRLVRGPNLKDMIIARELDAGRTLRILAPIADALDTAHGQGLIHRDIKPQNILVSGRDHAYLADFGLTKAPGEKSLTKTGQFVGTLDYISPEQIRGKPASKKSDIYALAAVLYECLTGIVPYPKDSEAAVLYAHMSDEPPSVTEERPELPGSLDDVIRQAMSKDPDQRQDSASQLMRDAEEAFSRKTRAAMTPPGPIESPQETGIRPRESDVSTREAGTQDSDELAAATRAQGGDPTRPALAGDVTMAAGAGATRAAGPGAEATRMGAGATAASAGATAGAATAPLPPPTGAPVRPAERRKVGGGLIAAAVVAGIAAAVIGFVVGNGGGSSGTEVPANNSSASAGVISLTFPDSWTRIPSAPAIPGYNFQDPIPLAPKNGGGGELTAGTVQSTDPSLLPPAFLKTLPGPPPKGDAVKLGDLQAYRYANLKPKGYTRQLTLYTVPTTAGVATVACAADPAKAATFQPDCERIASTLTLNGATAYQLGVPKAYSAKLNSTLSRMQAQRDAALSRLRSAKAPAGQASAARQAAAAYGAAARSLSSGVPPQVSGANAKIVAALHQSQRGYLQMAAGALSGDRGRYASGKAQVAKGDAALAKALEALKSSAS